MNRTTQWFVLVVWGFAATAFGADPPADNDQPQTIKLILHPAREPKPALKYQLLPPIPNRTPGNAALVYPKSRLERGSNAIKAIYEAEEKCSDWLELPSEQLPLDEVRAELGKMSDQLGYADDGARRDYYMGDLPLHNGFSLMTLLPEVSQVRGLARLTAMRARLQVAEGKYDEAIRSMQTGFSMAHQIGQEPLVVYGLVGMAIEQTMCVPVEDWISRPDSPNLYWALSALPRPYVDLSRAWGVEHSIVELCYPQFKDLEKRRYGVEEMHSFVDNLVRDLRLLGSGRTNRAQFEAGLTVLCIKAYPAAKRYLIEQGRTAEEVEAMPVLQAVALHTLTVFRELRDEQFRWLYLPYHEAAEFLRREEERFAKEAPNREIIPIAQIYMPAMRMVYAGAVRADRRVAVLRLIEALRLYAADHEGRLPSKLSDITAVPVPTDPTTGKSFEYTQSGDTATINSPAPLSHPVTSALRYEIKMLPK